MLYIEKTYMVLKKKEHLLLFCSRVCFLYVVLLTAQFFSKEVYAANFANASMRHSRMAISLAASSTDPILVIFKPATTGTEASIGIAFASGYTVDSTNTNITISTASLPSSYHGLTSITAPPGIGKTMIT
jgi:hypothetical protein